MGSYNNEFRITVQRLLLHKKSYIMFFRRIENSFQVLVPKP